MKFYIREWSNNTVVLMTESGHVLAYFSSITDALNVCEEWYSCNLSEHKSEIMIQYKQADSSYISCSQCA